MGKLTRAEELARRSDLPYWEQVAEGLKDLISSGTGTTLEKIAVYSQSLRPLFPKLADFDDSLGFACVFNARLIAANEDGRMRADKREAIAEFFPLREDRKRLYFARERYINAMNAIHIAQTPNRAMSYSAFRVKTLAGAAYTHWDLLHEFVPLLIEAVNHEAMPKNGLSSSSVKPTHSVSPDHAEELLANLDVMASCLSAAPMVLAPDPEKYHLREGDFLTALFLMFRLEQDDLAMIFEAEEFAQGYLSLVIVRGIAAQFAIPGLDHRELRLLRLAVAEADRKASPVERFATLLESRALGRNVISRCMAWVDECPCRLDEDEEFVTIESCVVHWGVDVIFSIMTKVEDKTGVARSDSSLIRLTRDLFDIPE